MSVNTLSEEMRAEIKMEIRRWTHRQWRVAFYVVGLIVISGMFLRSIYNQSMAMRSHGKAGVHDSVNAR